MHVRKSVDRDVFNFFGTLCWSLWQRRNKFVMEKSVHQPSDVVSSSLSFLQDFHYAVVQNPKAKNPTGVRWCHPQPEIVRVSSTLQLCGSLKVRGLGYRKRP
ncbi:hypothetical protein Salat_0209000 [Sesamum alatum]|uniref:Uncharacterized protein n=1 Tax=Sesamum alatum TaxID=300844 RepID=A0AAE1YYP4_9LAMI|nr:hypothetical protein Salat_0209000 [Sesamum alatum]